MALLIFLNPFRSSLKQIMGIIVLYLSSFKERFT